MKTSAATGIEGGVGGVNPHSSLKVPSMSGLPPPPIFNDQFNKKEGWLSTRKKVGGWKRRFVVLKGCKMQVYRDASFKVLKDEHNLAGGSVSVLFTQGQASGPQYALKLTTKASSNSSNVVC
jgi:hypothetical protein